MNKKSLATIQIVDLFGEPIAKAHYEVKNQHTGQLIATGSTNAKGCIVEISRDKGTVLDVFIKSMFKGAMIKVQSFSMSKDRMLVKITSPKVLVDLNTLENKGSHGQYKRKTHIVKKGETLSVIAQQNNTTVRALERLNNIDDPDKISIGQVIKLPVHIAATGNHNHQDKPKTTEQKKSQTTTSTVKPSQSSTTASKTTQTTSSTPSKTTPQAKSTTTPTQKLDQAYDQRKKELAASSPTPKKIPTTNDRSYDVGTPKASATNLCKTNPQCISSGKSELIREVNIRLAGFGGALPTDEFTELTAKCIKQFQRDYMGVPETGKICGSLLTALDKFYTEYGIADYFESMRCVCKKCTGFGSDRKGVYTLVNYNRKTHQTSYPKVDLWEPPGLHRPLIWIYKALKFYLKKEGGYKIVGISSGYRCVDENLRVRRSSINHMGCALDILIADKNGRRIINQELQKNIREKIVQKYMNAAFDWNGADNIPNMESYQYGATTWLHIDTRKFQKTYKEKSFFSKTIIGLNGDLMINILKENKLDQLLACSGMLFQKEQISSQNTGKLFTKHDAEVALKKIYDIYGKEIAIIVEKMYRCEGSHFKSDQYKNCGTPGMESHGSAPYYGWDSNLFIEKPTGTWAAYENKGLSGMGGNQQVKDKKKVFICVSSVFVGMKYVAEYIKKHNGNYGRWFSKVPAKQAVYRARLGEIKARIVETF